MTNQRSPEESAQARESRLETAGDDIFGVDFKIGRTLRDMVVRPGRVADAALANDHSRYTRPLKVYLALMAVLTLAFGWSDLGELNTLTSLFANNPERLARVQTHLAEVGSSIAEADAVARKWSGWTIWPATAVSSLIFVLAIWGMRRRLGLFNAFQLYLVASNAASVLTIPLVVAGMVLSRGVMIAVSVIGMVAFVVYCALVLHRRAADTALGLSLRTAGVVATMLPATAAMLVLSPGMLEIAFRIEIGVSWLQLIAGTAAMQPGTPP